MSDQAWTKRTREHRSRISNLARSLEDFSERVPSMVANHELAREISGGMVNSLIYQSQMVAEHLRSRLAEIERAEQNEIILIINESGMPWHPLQEMQGPAAPDDAGDVA